MAVYQVDVQMSVPEPFGLAGRYYWTWIWYLVADSDTQALVRALAQTENQARSSYTAPDVRYHGYQVTSPPRSGNIIGTYPDPNLHGLRTAGVLGPIENVMRMKFYANDRLVSWRFWRAGFYVTDYVGQEWDSTQLANWYGKVLVLVDSGYNCSLHGELITSASIDKRIGMANLRHGTKRRARKVIP